MSATGNLFCAKGRTIATDSARSKTRTEPLLRSELRRLAGHIAGLAAFLGSAVSIKGEKSEVKASGRLPGASLRNRMGKSQVACPTRARTDLGLPRLDGLWGNGRGTPQVGGGPGGDHCPDPELRSTRGAQAGPTPGSRARRPRRAHQVAMPAPDKGPGLRSPAGATSWPYPSRRAQPRRRGRDRGPEPAQTWRPEARVEGAPLPGRP